VRAVWLTNCGEIGRIWPFAKVSAAILGETRRACPSIGAEKKTPFLSYSLNIYQAGGYEAGRAPSDILESLT
jgi:hypothetical protein